MRKTLAYSKMTIKHRKLYSFHSSICRKAKPLIIKLPVFLILVLSSITTFGQLEPFLLLEKPGTKKRIRFYVGDKILFKQYDEKELIKGRIVAFTDSSFFINEHIEVPLRTVKSISDKSKVAGVRGMSMMAISSIPVFFVFSAANNIFNTGDRPIIDQEVYTLSGVFLGIGTLGMLYKGKKYRLKNKWRIIVVTL